MRARNIKPDFFRDAELSELSVETRYLFIGLWCLADREGKLKDKPKQIRFEVFTETKTRQHIHIMLQDLVVHGLIERYEVDDCKLIKIKNFLKHQTPHTTEKASVLPDPVRVDKKPNDINNNVDSREATLSNVNIPLNPDSLNPDLNTMSPPKGGNGSYSSDFLEIYSAYPKNRRGSKKEAFTQYRRLKHLIPPNVNQIIQRQISEKQKADSSGIFYPEFKDLHRWIRLQMWELEPFNFVDTDPLALEEKRRAEIEAQKTRDMREKYKIPKET